MRWRGWGGGKPSAGVPAPAHGPGCATRAQAPSSRGRTASARPLHPELGPLESRHSLGCPLAAGSTVTPFQIVLKVLNYLFKTHVNPETHASLAPWDDPPFLPSSPLCPPGWVFVGTSPL